MPHQTLRIIDANCNRIGEGLRFLEDIARFVLNDQPLTREFKTMRHSLVKHLSQLGSGLLTARNVEADIGVSIQTVMQSDLPALAAANARRVEEALRVVEELAKLPDISPKLDSQNLEKARFKLYTLEKALHSKLLRHQKTARIKGLYVIVDAEILGYKNEIEVASKAIRGGAAVIQLRDKHRSKRGLLTLAKEMNALCHSSGVLFIINDHLDIALAIECDGLHIGQEDLPLPLVRKELQIDKLIGVSTRTVEQAQEAETQGADYIAAGSVYSSPSKPEAEVIGLEQLRRIRQTTALPVVAIGGINRENIGEVMSTGVESAAVISAVITQENIEEATRLLVKAIETAKNNPEP